MAERHTGKRASLRRSLKIFNLTVLPLAQRPVPPLQFADERHRARDDYVRSTRRHTLRALPDNLAVLTPAQLLFVPWMHDKRPYGIGPLPPQPSYHGRLFNILWRAFPAPRLIAKNAHAWR
jgi:hypothetical protein